MAVGAGSTVGARWERAMQTTELVEQGREAFGRHAWPDAFALLEQADRTTALEPVDLERLATAAYLTGHDEASIDAWGRAHQVWLAQG